MAGEAVLSPGDDGEPRLRRLRGDGAGRDLLAPQHPGPRHPVQSSAASVRHHHQESAEPVRAAGQTERTSEATTTHGELLQPLLCQVRGIYAIPG